MGRRISWRYSAVSLCLICLFWTTPVEARSAQSEWWISAHRGGDTRGYPENAIETFAYSVSLSRRVWIECDISESADGVLMMMHDSTLSRTSTGHGYVVQTRWAKLKTLRLKDPYGHITPYRIPRLIDVLRWGKGKTQLFLDVKSRWPRGLRHRTHRPYWKSIFSRVVKMIQQQRAWKDVVVITYNVQQALYVHKLDKRLRLSVGLTSISKLQTYLRHIPAHRMIAFTGLLFYGEKPTLYQALKRHQVKVITATFRAESVIARLPLTDWMRRIIWSLMLQRYSELGIQIFAVNDTRQALTLLSQ